MAEKIVSPGVFTKEIDQTFLPAAIANIGAVVVGPTVKGPAMIPTVVNSYGEFQERFGSSFESGSDFYQYLTSHTAKEYLKNGSPLTVVRILAGDYSAASATISSSVDPSFTGGGVKATGSITINDGIYGQGSAEASMSIEGVTFTLTGSNTYTNSATSIFVHSGSGTTTTLAREFSDVIGASASLHGLPISASSADAVIGLTSSYAGRMHAADGFSIQIGSQISGTLDIIEDSAAFTIEDIQGGEDYNSQVPQEVFKLHTLSHGDILNNSGSLGNNSKLNNGLSNNLRYEIGSVNKNKGTFSVLIRRGDDTQNKKQILETWNNVNLDPNSSKYIAKVIGNQYFTMNGSGTDEPYLTTAGGDYPSKSKYVRVEVLKNTVDYLDVNGNVRVPAASASLPSFQSGSNSGSFGGSFDGGANGDINHPQSFYDNIDSVSNMQGLNLTIDQTGQKAYIDALNMLKNQDEYDFNLMLLPGVLGDTHTSVITKAIEVCETRGDCFVLADPTVKGSAITTATTEAETRDSSYASMYWPWVQITDTEVGTNRWVPASIPVAGMYAFNDKVAHPWFAPAGLNRGTLDTVVQTERQIIQSDRDTLYSAGVNPIATFPAQGVTVWGQKTLQKKPSALDRVNVRRLLIKVKKFIASTSRFLVFEQNNIKTRSRFLNIVNPYLSQVQSQSGLNEFRGIMDDTNNTPDVVDRNQLIGQIFLQPTRTAEFIVLDFTVQRTGASFAE